MADDVTHLVRVLSYFAGHCLTIRLFYLPSSQNMCTEIRAVETTSKDGSSTAEAKRCCLLWAAVRLKLRARNTFYSGAEGIRWSESCHWRNDRYLPSLLQQSWEPRRSRTVKRCARPRQGGIADIALPIDTESPVKLLHVHVAREDTPATIISADALCIQKIKA